MSWIVTPISGSLPRRNASPNDASDHLQDQQPVELDVSTIGYSPYLDRATQGATLAPRPFWFVVPDSASRARVLRVRTDAQQRDRAKEPWKGIELLGEVELDYVFATNLEIFPFRLGPTKLCILPLRVQDGRPILLTTRDVTRAGAPGLSDWLLEAESLWKERKKSSVAQDVDLPEYLDNHANLTRQRLTGGTKLVYGGKGSHVRAAVIDLDAAASEIDGVKPRGYVFDMNMYYVSVKTAAEAHYLAAILNTPYVDDGIKVSQTQGAWGARDIHRRPFEMFPIPEYDDADARHRRLAEISEIAHQRVAAATPSRRHDAQLEAVTGLVTEAAELARSICEAA